MPSLWRAPTIILTLVFGAVLSFPYTVSAQLPTTPVQCGTILEAELTDADLSSNGNYTVHRYNMSFRAGDRVTVRAEPIGAFLDILVGIFDPQGVELTYDREYDGDTVQIDPVLSASGEYLIVVNGGGDGKIGAYTIYFGCTLRNGTVIAPGDAPPDAQPTEQPTTVPELPTNFFGFRGLAPVDFVGVVPFSIPPGVPLTGGITPSGGEILGYLVNGSEGDILEIQFTRLSGNLNLGIVVLSQNNELVFQASLITTNTLTTQLILPSTGEYTVGVFRVDLLPPDAPEPTAFQIQAVVNP